MRCPVFRVEVAEHSMLPALRPGDWLLALRTRRIRPGQVVLAWHPARADFLLVKRAVRRVEGDGEISGGWWLESDNPAAGAVDSTRFGPVPDDLIVGRVLARYGRAARKRSSPVLSRTSALTASGPAPSPEGAGPDTRDSAIRGQPRSPVSGSSCSPACLLTRLSISAVVSLVRIAQ